VGASNFVRLSFSVRVAICNHLSTLITNEHPIRRDHSLIWLLSFVFNLIFAFSSAFVFITFLPRTFTACPWPPQVRSGTSELQLPRSKAHRQKQPRAVVHLLFGRPYGRLDHVPMHYLVTLVLLFCIMFDNMLLRCITERLIEYLCLWSPSNARTGALWTCDRGTLDCSKGAWKLFDGNTLHATEPYEGSRRRLYFKAYQGINVMYSILLIKGLAFCGWFRSQYLLRKIFSVFYLPYPITIAALTHNTPPSRQVNGSVSFSSHRTRTTCCCQALPKKLRSWDSRRPRAKALTIHTFKTSATSARLLSSRMAILHYSVFLHVLLCFGDWCDCVEHDRHFISLLSTISEFYNQPSFESMLQCSANFNSSNPDTRFLCY